MSPTYQGSHQGAGLRVAVVVARFNEVIGRRLLAGARDSLADMGVRDDDVTVVWVPGAFELPSTAKRLAVSGDFDALVCLGAVIRGETAHFDFVAGHAAYGLGEVALELGIPLGFVVLTTEDGDQAMARAGGRSGNKGAEAAAVAVEMATLFAALEGS